MNLLGHPHVQGNAIMDYLEVYFCPWCSLAHLRDQGIASRFRLLCMICCYL